MDPEWERIDNMKKRTRNVYVCNITCLLGSVVILSWLFVCVPAAVLLRIVFLFHENLIAMWYEFLKSRAMSGGEGTRAVKISRQSSSKLRRAVPLATGASRYSEPKLHLEPCIEM